METGRSGNFLRCLKAVKDTFEAQERRWDFLKTLNPIRVLSHVEGKISWFFLSCSKKVGVPLEF